jgi:drug/metabolite transporter (DMT)-like permease
MTPAGKTAGVDASGRPMSTRRDRRLAEAGVTLVALLWATNFIVVKDVVRVIPPVTLSALRFALAGLVLLVALRAREGTIRTPWRDLAGIALLGAIGFGVYQMLWTTGLQSVTAGDSALLIAATPVFTALLAVAAGSDTLTARKLAGAVISFAGVAVVIASGQRLSLDASLAGDLITLAAALCWATYTSFGASVLRRYSPLRTTAWAMLAGALVMAPIGAVQAASVDWASVTPDVWGRVLYSAVVPGAVATTVVFHGVKLLGPTRVTTFQFLVPAFAVLLAAVFLAEPIRLAQLLGGIVIVAGIAVTRTAAPRSPVARTSASSA